VRGVSGLYLQDFEKMTMATNGLQRYWFHGIDIGPVAVPKNRKESVIPEFRDAKTTADKFRLENQGNGILRTAVLDYPDRQKGANERKYFWQLECERWHFQWV
jgi:hypothetical protein